MRFRQFALIVLFVCLTTSIAAPAHAEVHPHPLFTDGAVLQQGGPVPIWGTADEGEKVTVRFRDSEVSTNATDGRWMVRIEPGDAGGPFDLTISGTNAVTVKNVLVGEVWVASGQSNMQWSVLASADPETVVANSKNSMLRLFSVPLQSTPEPQTTVDASWQECGPETVGGFSAVAYHFGRDLQESLGVPVGMINTSYGGTPAEAWTSAEELSTNPKLKHITDEYAKVVAGYAKALEEYEAAVEEHKKAVEKAKADGKQPPQAPQAPFGPGHPHSPAGLYNAMIHPLQPYAIKGAIWYQGESNAGRAWEYRTLFPAMIADWRRTWDAGDFPFYFVQLAPFMAKSAEPGDSAWAELRDAQLYTSLTTPHTGIAVITDVGDEADIHPKWKAPVGERLALTARALDYGQDVEYSGPLYKSLRIDGSRALLTFEHVGGGLVAKEGPLTGFTIAGSDEKFHNATAEIVGDEIVVTCPDVPEPVAVRFGWANYPQVNLWNKADLPASPFRTDEFKLTTQK